jgi:hypothetical protein
MFLPLVAPHPFWLSSSSLQQWLSSSQNNPFSPFPWMLQLWLWMLQLCDLGCCSILIFFFSE